MTTTRSRTEELPHVIIFGSRLFADYDLLRERMDRYTVELGRLYVCTGEWRGIGIGTPQYIGADLLGERWAAERKFTVKRFPPPFEDFTKANRVGAFHARNREMVTFVAGVRHGFAVGFWDGTSPGTASVIELLVKHKVKHRVVRY